MDKLNFCFLVFMFSMQCYFMVSLSLSKINLTTDEFALLAFKSSITKDLHSHLANWSHSSSPCSWVGVTCDARHERIHKLNLSDLGLEGTIPPQMGNLSFLIHLDLSNNSFHGQLPNDIFRLRRLKLLNLSNNRFTGEVPAWIGLFQELRTLRLRNNHFGGLIPSSISNLSKLESLDFNDNVIKGSIPIEIGQLSQLRDLHISGNNLSGIIPSIIRNISSLELLSLSYNNLSGDIPTEIVHLPQLTILYLGQNQLSGSIPRNIGNLTILEELDLSYNNLKGDIPKGIANLSQLTSIGLSSNQLSGSIQRDIGNLIMLEEFELDRNNLIGDIPKEISHLSQLKIIHLTTNQLSGSIPRDIGNLTILEELDLSINNLEGDIPREIGRLSKANLIYLDANLLSGSIPRDIGDLTIIEELELSYNNLKGSIPNTIGNLRDLQWFNVHENNLTYGAFDPEFNSFTSLMNCKHLKHLDLSNNPLHTKLPKSIGNLSNTLEEFLADSCSLRGKIPLEIGNLSKLIGLSLSENDLNGPIPSTISGLQNLQVLSIKGNSLQGSIVDKLCEISGLSTLYLSTNNLSEGIPACLGNLTHLSKLDLSSNRLVSQIPSSLWNLKDVLEVNISSNALEGKLPLEIENLRALILLDLSRNQISSTLPTTITSLETLQTLFLARNKLEGPIPESLGNLLSLEFLDFSQNELSGMIPKSLESLVGLKYINLSYNRLQGEIPSDGPFAKFPAQSFMHNKALCGKAQFQVPPCSKKDKKRSITKLLLIKIILPIIMSATLVVSCGIFYLRAKRSDGHSNERNLSTLGAPRRISYYEIQQATNRFDESNLLGRGSISSVFKGVLSREVMAFKVFNLESEAMSRSFDVECTAMRNLRHRNLIKIISSCSNIDFKCLVMEFMPNGSLEKWLYSHEYHLNFLQRLNIMIDVASALEYLHHGSSTPAVHCDLKPNNILLDEDMVARVSDFGISKLLEGGQSKIYTKTLSTIGYIAPECGSKGFVSIKGDVYSYGIMLLEVFTRKKPTDDMFVDGLSLKSWISESMPHAISQVMDSILLQEQGHHGGDIIISISSIFELALSCCTDLPEARMNMKDMVVSLNKIKTAFVKRRPRGYRPNNSEAVTIALAGVA